MKPEIGQDVHYVIPVGEAHCRAQIVNIVDRKKGIVALFVVPDVSGVPFFFTWNAQFSPCCEPGTWHLIEREGMSAA